MEWGGGGGGGGVGDRDGEGPGGSKKSKLIPALPRPMVRAKKEKPARDEAERGGLSEVGQNCRPKS